MNSHFSRFHLIIGVTLFLCPFWVSAQNVSDNIADLFEEWNSPDSPGASVAVMQKGKVVYSGAFGSADLEHDLPIVPETVFHAASLSKQFTAFSILQLADAGKLSIDDDVHKYIPELQDYGETVTLWHMLTHTSGLRDQWRLTALAGWAREDVVRNREILDLAAMQRGLNFTPGDRFMYSNLGYTLLAEIVARVSGMSFAEYTQKNIFTPLGMDETQFYDDYHKIVKNRAYSYGMVDGELVKRPLNFSTVGATSLFSTAEDLLKWGHNFSTLKVGNKAIIEQMNKKTVLNSGKEIGILAGQFIGTYLGKTLYYHSGSDAGFRAFLLRAPEDDLNVAVLGNISTINGELLAATIASYFFSPTEEEEKSETEPAASKGDYPHPEDIFIELPDADLKPFVGKYWEHQEWYNREIRMTDKGLEYYRPESGATTQLKSISPTEFKMIDDTEDVSIRFGKREDGISTMIVQVNDKDEIEHLRYEDVALTDYSGTYGCAELAVKYSITERDGELILYHLRKGEVSLQPVAKDYFTSGDRNFKKVQFLRNAEGDLTGFTVTNGGVVGMEFLRE